ncbi:fibulin-1-like [Sycon ciliatum]|uniref:fibulin-1-like n=1 Tax=Sycon ciliatum TaxID=27933 RepID=UPI0031F648BB
MSRATYSMQLPLLQVFGLLAVSALVLLQEIKASELHCNGFNISSHLDPTDYKSARSVCSRQQLTLLRIKDHNRLRRSTCYSSVLEPFQSGGIDVIWLDNLRSKSALRISTYNSTVEPTDEPKPFICAKDFNECKDADIRQVDLCPNGYTCENTKGSYTCEERNECEEAENTGVDLCPSGYTCKNTNGGYQCEGLCGGYNISIHTNKLTYRETRAVCHGQDLRRLKMKDHNRLRKSECYNGALQSMLDAGITNIWLDNYRDKDVLNISTHNSTAELTDQPKPFICAKDFDECTNGGANLCPNGTRCQNQKGTYSCEAAECLETTIPNGVMRKVAHLEAGYPLCDSGYMAIGQARCVSNEWQEFKTPEGLPLCQQLSTCPGPDGSKYFIHREPDMNQTYHTHFERCTIGFDSRLPASMDIPCLQQILTQSLANEPDKGFRSIFLHGTNAGHVLSIDDDGAFTATTLSSDQKDEFFPGATHKVCMPFCQQTVTNRHHYLD